MEKLTKQDLSMILGGSSQPVDYDAMSCGELQNFAGLYWNYISEAEKEKWAEACLKKCGGAIVTPSQPNPTTPEN